MKPACLRTRDVSGQSWMLSVKQVHGTDALIVDRPAGSDQFQDGWDALITDQPGDGRSSYGGLCSVLVYDRRRKVAIHAGWRGALAGIVPKTIQLMISILDR